jgi:hypothetical protein
MINACNISTLHMATILQENVQAEQQHTDAEARRAEAAAVSETLAKRALEQQRAVREVQRLQVRG